MLKTKDNIIINIKFCTKCGETKPIDQFYNNCTQEDGLQSQCKKCTAANNIKWQRANLAKAVGYSAKWAAKNREHVNAYTRTQYLLNPEMFRTNRQRRIKHGVENEVFIVTAKEKKAMKDKLCYLCGITPSKHIDHIIPISKGGRWSVGNLAGACKSCNSSKNNKYLIEFKYRAKMAKTKEPRLR